jgi:hypothetical protein
MRRKFPSHSGFHPSGLTVPHPADQVILAYELMIECRQDVKSYQKEQEDRYIEVQREKNKRETKPSAGETGSAGARPISLKTGVPTRLVSKPAPTERGARRSRTGGWESAKVSTTLPSLKSGAASAKKGSLESVGLYGEHKTDDGCRDYKKIQGEMNYTRKTIKKFIPGSRGCRLLSADPDEKPDYDEHKDQDPHRHVDRQS